MVSKSAPSAKKVLLNLFLSIVIIGLLGFGFITTNQLNDTQAVLASTQNDLTITQSNLSSAKATLATAETELSQTQDELATTQTNLSDNLTEFAFLDMKLDQNRTFLKQLTADYETTSAALATEKTLAATLQSNLGNLQVNIGFLTTGFGYVLNNPTYLQCKIFIATDITNTRTYVQGVYESDDFALDVKTNAMKQHIRCAYVSVRFVGDSSGESIIAFNTTDRGIVYIEPQTDEEVNLRVGWHYWTQCLITNVNWTTSFDDTVGRFNITW